MYLNNDAERETFVLRGMQTCFQGESLAIHYTAKFLALVLSHSWMCLWSDRIDRVRY